MTADETADRSAEERTDDSRAEVPPPARPAWTNTAVLGLVLAAAGPLVFFVGGAIGGLDLGDGVFFLVVAAIALLGAFLVSRFSLVGKILGIVASLLVGLALFWTVFGLAYPSSFVDFVPGVLVPVGVIMGLAGSIAALVSRSRRRPSPALREAGLRTGVLALVGVVAVVSALMTQVSRETVDPTDAEGAIAVTMEDFAYTEGTYEVEPGESAEFLIHNSDPVVHTFTIAQLGVNKTVLPGSDALVEIDGADAGTYTIYCVPHSAGPDADPDDDGEMAATLEVSG